MENSKFKNFIRSNMMWLILVLIIAVFAILSPNFRSFRNLMNILNQNAYFMVATIGVALIMISGGTGRIAELFGVKASFKENSFKARLSNNSSKIVPIYTNKATSFPFKYVSVIDLYFSWPAVS